MSWNSEPQLKLTGGVESDAAASGRWRVDWLVVFWLTLNSDLPIATIFDRFHSIYSSLIILVRFVFVRRSFIEQRWRGEGFRILVSMPEARVWERWFLLVHTQFLVFRLCVCTHTYTKSRMICSNQIELNWLWGTSENASSTVGGSSFKHRSRAFIKKVYYSVTTFCSARKYIRKNVWAAMYETLDLHAKRFVVIKDRESC